MLSIGARGLETIVWGQLFIRRQMKIRLHAPMSENTTDQRTLAQYTSVEKINDEWGCTVCGRTTERKSVVKHCHLHSHLSRIRESSITEENDSHQGFVYPQALHPDVRDFLATVETAIQDSQTTPLWPATDVILDQARSNLFRSQAMQVFAHLVFLQQHQVLPGYPLTTIASETKPVSLQQFIEQTDQVEGAITTDELAASDAVTQERIYRATVYTTTDEFLSKSQILPNSLWAWRTERVAVDETVNTDVIFGEGTAHNVVTAQVCKWLATHPKLEWTCAPHVIPTTIGEQICTIADDTEADPPIPEPTIMFDFAGFTEHEDQRGQHLALAGFVIENEQSHELGELLYRAAQPKTACLLVFPNRDSIIDCIRYAYSEGLFEDDIAPTQNVVEYYESRPSISHINTAIAKGSNTTRLRFLSRKQLIDGFVDPVSVLPDEIPPSRE